MLVTGSKLKQIADNSNFIKKANSYAQWNELLEKILNDASIAAHSGKYWIEVDIPKESIEALQFLLPSGFRLYESGFFNTCWILTWDNQRTRGL